jgi:hypothetical protein
MTFFVVTWDNRDVSFIWSADLHELKKKLYYKNPKGSYVIQIYKGPIFFTFKTLLFFQQLKSADDIFIEGEEKIFQKEKKSETPIFSKYYKSKEFSDINLKVKNEIIPSHKIILNNYEFFSSKIKDKNEIEIENIGMTIFEIIFYFVYFEDLENYKLKLGEDENLQIWFNTFQKSKELKISNKLCELCEIEMIKLYENSEMSLVFEYNASPDVLNSNSEEELMMEIHKFGERKKKFAKSIPNRLKKLIPILNQAHKIQATKFVSFVLNELKHHAKVPLKGLDDDLKDLINKLKDNVVWNPKSISVLKESYPSIFVLNQEMKIPESIEMWKRISKNAFPIFTNTIEQKNLKLKKIDLMIRKSILEDDSDFKHEKLEVDIPPFSIHLENSKENKFLY